MNTTTPVANSTSSEKSYFSCCLDPLKALVNRINELFWGALEMLCPCFFAKEPAKSSAASHSAQKGGGTAETPQTRKGRTDLPASGTTSASAAAGSDATALSGGETVQAFTGSSIEQLMQRARNTVAKIGGANAAGNLAVMDRLNAVYNRAVDGDTSNIVAAQASSALSARGNLPPQSPQLPSDLLQRPSIVSREESDVASEAPADSSTAFVDPVTSAQADSLSAEEADHLQEYLSNSAPITPQRMESNGSNDLFGSRETDADLDPVVASGRDISDSVRYGSDTLRLQNTAAAASFLDEDFADLYDAPPVDSAENVESWLVDANASQVSTTAIDPDYKFSDEDGKVDDSHEAARDATKPADIVSQFGFSNEEEERALVSSFAFVRESLNNEFSYTPEGFDEFMQYEKEDAEGREEYLNLMKKEVLEEVSYYRVEDQTLFKEARKAASPHQRGVFLKQTMTKLKMTCLDLSRPIAAIICIGSQTGSRTFVVHISPNESGGADFVFMNPYGKASCKVFNGPNSIKNHLNTILSNNELSVSAIPYVLKPEDDAFLE